MDKESIIVPSWWKKWSVWLSTTAVFLPEILQWVLNNWALLDLLPFMDDGHKNILRVVLVSFVPVVAAIKQKSVPPKNAA
jgi:hypothetical protein